MISPIWTVAEAGVNHNGSLSLAKKLADAAKNAGADAVKFQSFSADELAKPDTELVPYQIGSARSHYDMLKKLELSRDDQIQLKEHCHDIEIEFMSTPYSVGEAQFLAEIGVSHIKVASADLVDLAMHEFLSELNSIEIIVSTGMATIEEVKRVAILYQANSKAIHLMQCVSNYPSSAKSQNLNVISTYLGFGCGRVGFSDHTKSSLSALVALGRGATFFEKHLTLNKSMKGPDHKASLTPKEFGIYVRDLREGFDSLGSYEKFPVNEELEMRRISRKGAYLTKDVSAGESIIRSNVALSRPGLGTDPWQVLQSMPFAAKFDHKSGELLN